MKSLNTIQTLSKIGKVLSKIIYICCIVGLCGCVVGIVAMLIGAETLKLGGMTLRSALESEAGVSEGTVWASIAAGMLLCAGEFVVSRMACRYFENELNAGTPFTVAGAKELFRLGIVTICVPLGAMILAQIVSAIVAELAGCGEVFQLEGGDSVALGVMFIVMSVLCRYGAELNEEKERSQTLT